MAEQRGPFPRRKTGFTIVELLVVIGIIVVLISLLVPAVSRVRRKAQDAATQAFMSQLSQAIDAYNTDFRAYPGPILDNDVNNTAPSVPIQMDSTVPTADWEIPAGNLNDTVTMSENLVLGLLGGLHLGTGTPAPVLYDPRLIGNGPSSLKSGPVKRTQAYLEAKNLSWRQNSANKKTGLYMDENGTMAIDSIIPEFVDSFSDPMPFLYLRAKKGQKGPAVDATNNAVMTYDPALTPSRLGQYDLHQIIGYTKTKIGGGRNPDERKGYAAADDIPHGLHDINTNLMATMYADHDGKNSLVYKQPFDAYTYFRNSTLSTPDELDSAFTTQSNRIDVAHQKDEYILISAGQDRIYGTKDDITNFGAVTK